MKSKNVNRPKTKSLIYIILTIIVFTSCNQSRSIQIDFINPNTVKMDKQVVVVSRKIFEERIETNLEDFIPVPASRF